MIYIVSNWVRIARNGTKRDWSQIGKNEQLIMAHENSKWKKIVDMRCDGVMGWVFQAIMG